MPTEQFSSIYQQQFMSNEFSKSIQQSALWLLDNCPSFNAISDWCYRAKNLENLPSIDPFYKSLLAKSYQLICNI